MIFSCWRYLGAKCLAVPSYDGAAFNGFFMEQLADYRTKRQSPWPLEYGSPLLTARSSDEDPETPFVEYLVRSMKKPLDLIKAPAAACAAASCRSAPRRWCLRQDERRVQSSLLTRAMPSLRSARLPRGHEEHPAKAAHQNIGGRRHVAYRKF